VKGGGVQKRGEKKKRGGFFTILSAERRDWGDFSVFFLAGHASIRRKMMGVWWRGIYGRDDGRGGGKQDPGVNEWK